MNSKSCALFVLLSLAVAWGDSVMYRDIVYIQSLYTSNPYISVRDTVHPCPDSTTVEGGAIKDVHARWVIRSYPGVASSSDCVKYGDLLELESYYNAYYLNTCGGAGCNAQAFGFGVNVYQNADREQPAGTPVYTGKWKIVGGTTGQCVQYIDTFKLENQYGGGGQWLDTNSCNGGPYTVHTYGANTRVGLSTTWRFEEVQTVTPTSLGCWKDQTDRDLQGAWPLRRGATIETCAAACTDYLYFGLQFGGHCFCDNSYGTYGPADNCNLPCTANTAQLCGGKWANSVYSNDPVTATPESTIVPPATVSPVPIDDTNYMGCWLDKPARDLNGFWPLKRSATKETCAAACDGFQYYGLQFGGHCFCDDSYGSYGPADNCDTPCTANNAQICGGKWANAVYHITSTATPVVTATTSPLPTITPDANGYLGCWKDELNRDLEGAWPIKVGATKETCQVACESFLFYSLQWGGHCFCDNSFGTYGPADNCNMPCTANNAQNCGGEWANAVYQNNADTAAPVPQNTPTPDPNLPTSDPAATWTPGVTNAPDANGYVGCWKDRGVRDLTGDWPYKGGATHETCAQACIGFLYWGVQFGGHCFCDNSYGTYGPADNCNTPCTANSQQNCGGTWANAIYAQSAQLTSSPTDPLANTATPVPTATPQVITTSTATSTATSTSSPSATSTSTSSSTSSPGATSTVTQTSKPGSVNTVCLVKVNLFDFISKKGETITFTAGVANAQGTSSSHPKPSGSVVLKEGTTTVATITLNGQTGTGTATSNKLTTGWHKIKASYSGDGSHTATQCNSLFLIVYSGATRPGKTTCNFKPPRPVPGRKRCWDLEATVSKCKPDSKVTFRCGDKDVATVPVVKNKGTWQAKWRGDLPVGSQKLCAIFNGDSENAASETPETTQVIPRPTKVSTKCGADKTKGNVKFQSKWTITGTVETTQTGGDDIYGKCEVWDQNGKIGETEIIPTANKKKGTVSWSSTSLKRGIHNIYFKLPESLSFKTSASLKKTVVVA